MDSTLLDIFQLNPTDVCVKVQSQNVIFYQIFNQLAQVSPFNSIDEVVTWQNFTIVIDFRLLKPIQYFCCIGIRHCDVMILNRQSIENRTHFTFSIDFRLCFRLVTWYYFSQNQISWENLIENLMENFNIWPHL